MAQQDSSDTLNPVKQWCFLTGSRSLFTAVVLFGILVVTGVLVETGIVYVGAGSSLRSTLASGMFSGLLTLITVALSINQLILSRVFGSPADLTDRLEGNLDFREKVEEIADVPASPNEPGAFLALIAEELESRAAQVERLVVESDEQLGDEFEDLTSDLVKYAEHLGEAEGTENTLEVLHITLGTEYADHIDTTRKLQNKYGDRLPEEATGHLESMLELLKSVAVIRQFFKTLAIQQDLAALSRRLIYSGVVAVLLTYYLSAVYTASSSMPTTIAAGYMPVVMTVVTPLVLSPLVVLVVYLLRVATVTLYTASVGSFVPPEERVETT
jgi:hypothetical protein